MNKTGQPVRRAGLVMLILTAIVVGWFGWTLRDRLWVASADTRFRWDIDNARRQGMGVVRDALPVEDRMPTLAELFRAWRDRYERVKDRRRDGGLDYPPGRLLVMSLWMRHVAAVQLAESTTPKLKWLGFRSRLDVGRAVSYRDADVTPLLLFNKMMGLIGAVGVAMLVAHAGRGAWMSVVAGALVWLNPVVLLNGHAWPQWDVWVVPFVAWSAWAALTGRWLAVGAMIACGAMLKGQTLFCLPFFFAWAVGSLQWSSLFGLLVGFAGGFVLLASPMLLVYAAPAWVVFAAVCVVALACVPMRRTSALGLVGMSACAVALLAARFGTSTAWLEVGFPTDRYPTMSMGPTANLPAVLHATWNWTPSDPVRFGPIALSMKQVLAWNVFAMIAIAGFLASRHARRNDPAVLFCVAAPWAVFFAFMPQMHERYLIWASVLSAGGAVLSTAGLSLHLALTLLAMLMTAVQLLNVGGGSAAWPRMMTVMKPLIPQIGWAVVVVAIASLILCVRGRRAPTLGHDS
jgi:hypothetical protein